MSPFLQQYRDLDDEEIDTISDIKIKAEKMYAIFEMRPSREMAIAKTKLEEAVMWAVKAVTA